MKQKVIWIAYLDICDLKTAYNQYFWSDDPNKTSEEIRFCQVGKISRKGVLKVILFLKNIQLMGKFTEKNACQML